MKMFIPFLAVIITVFTNAQNKSVFPDWVNNIKKPAISKNVNPKSKKIAKSKDYKTGNQKQLIYTYVSFAIITNDNVGNYLNTKAIVTIDYQSKFITVQKRKNEIERYKIVSDVENGQTSSGNKYVAMLATSNSNQFYFTFFNEKLLIINKETKNGLALYK